MTDDPRALATTAMADAPPSPKAILRGHKAQIHAAAFLRDNERLATGDADGHVVIWDLAIMRPAASWRAHENAILGLQGWGRDKFITYVPVSPTFKWHGNVQWIRSRD